MSCTKDKGKQRERINITESALLPLNAPNPIVNKSRRVETKECPVCLEMIPIRLLAAHEVLELQRIDDMLKGALPDVEVDPNYAEFDKEKRPAALKARKSFSYTGRRHSSVIQDTEKSLSSIKKRRRDRHRKLRESVRSDFHPIRPRRQARPRDAELCPICFLNVSGEMLQAHVDQCLLEIPAEIPRGEDDRDEYEWAGETRIRLTSLVGFSGTGFDIRNPAHEDVEDEIDVDGSDEIIFGRAQFSESDVLNGLPDKTGADSSTNESPHRLQQLETRRDDEDNQLYEMDPLERLNLAVEIAKARGKDVQIISALNAKIRFLEDESVTRSSPTTSSGDNLRCRICLSSYQNPTVSTGCWHSFCQDCWLRCLGSNKLCPICKRITTAVELRRVFL